MAQSVVRGVLGGQLTGAGPLIVVAEVDDTVTMRSRTPAASAARTVSSSAAWESFPPEMLTRITS